MPRVVNMSSLFFLYVCIYACALWSFTTEELACLFGGVAYALAQLDIYITHSFRNMHSRPYVASLCVAKVSA